MSYTHLSLAERHYIEIEHNRGTCQKKIGQALNRSQSTISREIRRNHGARGYRHKQANEKAQARHRVKPKAVKRTDPIKQQIDERLERRWSPEQIAGRFKAQGMVRLHHETIYQYIARDKRQGGLLYTHLRHQNKRYRKRYGAAHARTTIPNRVAIDERPQAANERMRIGDWEADTMIGKQHQGVLITLDERKSKVRLAAPLASKKAQGVKDAMIELLQPIRTFVKTITFDNGKEFTMHEQVAKQLQCATYFAKPYHSWERGQNENANGLLRQYFPKSMALIDVTVQQVAQAVDQLNNRPRKCLAYKTPYEAFQQITGVNLRRLFSDSGLMALFGGDGCLK